MNERKQEAETINSNSDKAENARKNDLEKIHRAEAAKDREEE